MFTRILQVANAFWLESKLGLSLMLSTGAVLLAYKVLFPEDYALADRRLTADFVIFVLIPCGIIWEWIKFRRRLKHEERLKRQREGEE